MKALQVLLNNDHKPRQPLQLFSKLRELKEKEGSIKGVTLVQSDEEDEEEAIKLIQDKLNLFKEQKAREVADVHNRTKESIESIVLRLKDDMQYQALCIINPAVSKNSVERREKPRKEMGSTLPGSVERSKAIDTPGFDLPSSKSRSKELTIDLREFTLGQKEQGSSNQSKQSIKDGSYVSEFNVTGREPSSRRIKDKIMNSNKNHK